MARNDPTFGVSEYRIGEAERAIVACTKIDPSLTSSDAIVTAVRHQPQIKEILRGILTPRHPSQLYEALSEGLLLFLFLWTLERLAVRAGWYKPGLLGGAFLLLYFPATPDVQLEQLELAREFSEHKMNGVRTSTAGQMLWGCLQVYLDWGERQASERL